MSVLPTPHNTTRSFIPYAALFLAAVIAAAVTGQPELLLIPFIAIALPVVTRRLYYLLFVLLFTLPLSTEYHFTGALGMDVPDEPLMIVLAGIFVLLIADRPSLLQRAWPVHPLTTLLLLLFCWGIITTVFSANVLLSLKYLAAKCWYLVAFVALPLLLFRTVKQWVVAATCILLPMTWVVVQSVVRHATLGFSFEGINLTVSPYFRNHVNYGAAVAAVLPILVAAGPWAKRKGLLWAWVLLLLLFVAGTVLSYSRGAWLAVPVAIVTVWAVRKRMVLWLPVLCFAGVMAVGGWLLTNNRYLDYRPDYNKTIFHTDLGDHLTATYQGRDMSTTERFYRWIAAVRMGADHPLTGVGPNNFYDSYKPYTASAFKTYVSDNPEHSTVHNYLLLLLTEQGVPGLLLFVLLLFVLFYELQRQYHRETDLLYRRMIVAVTAMLAMLVTVNFLSDLIETDKVGGLFFLCIAFVVYNGCRKNNEAVNP